MSTKTVYGERLADLAPALVAIHESMKIMKDGRYRFAVTLAPDEATPLRRALLRAEAELMFEEAATIGTASYEDRTHEQRAAEAFARLVFALNDGAPSRAALDGKGSEHGHAE